MPVPSPAVLGAGTEEQPAGDVAFTLLLSSTWGYLLQVGFLVPGIGYRFVGARRKYAHLSTVIVLIIINEH